MKRIADVGQTYPVLEFLAGEGEVSRRLGSWLDAHPGVALAIFLAAGLMVMTADSWF